MPSPIRILDGGLGTSLEDRYGVQFSQAETPLWSSHLLVDDSSSPSSSILRHCQADFCRAGVDILETATYQIGPQTLQRAHTAAHPDGLPVDSPAVYGLLERAICLGEAAIQERSPSSTTTSLALSLGPYGACMAPSTEYSGLYDAGGRGLSALQRWHADRLRLFAAAVPRFSQRVRWLAFETVPRCDEIAAIRAVMDDPGRDGYPEALSSLLRLPYWISCVFPEDATGLPDGSSVEDAVSAMLAAGDPASASSHPPSAIGINCTKLHRLPALVASYEAAVAPLVASGQLPAWPALVLYPDGTNGEIYDTHTQQWVRPLEDAAASDRPRRPWESQLSELVLATAQRNLWREILVGGCCKTTDRDIRALRESLKKGGGI